MTDDPNQFKSTRAAVTDSAVSDVSDLGKTLIGGIAPAEKGWVLGFICVVALIVGSDMYVSIKTIRANEQNAVVQAEYFTKIEANRSSQMDKAMQQWAEQTRRYQEIIRDLTESVARDSERAGQAAVAALDEATRQQYIDSVQEPPLQ